MRTRTLSCLILAVAAACGSTAKKPAPPGPAAGAAGVAVAPTPPKAVTPADPLDATLPVNPRVTTGKLANGLTYFILPHKQPQARVQLWLTVNAGSILEDDDQRGLAHLIEHMAFNGTKHYPGNQVVDLLEKAGMKFGPDVNAYTSFDETVYQLQFPSDNAKDVDTGLQILRDWAGDITFDQKELDKERGVVLEEWRLGRGAGERLFAKQAPIIYQGSRYPDRLPIGLPEIIKGAPRDRLVQFYKDWYRPDLMAVVIVGDIDPAQLEAAVKTRFADLVNPGKERPRTDAPIPHDHALLSTIATDKEMPFTQIAIYDKLDHRPQRSERDYHRLLVEQLFHAMLNQRLAEVARRPDAPFIAGFSVSDPIGRQGDAFVRFAQAQAGRAEDALTGLYREIIRIQRHGFTATELDRAKTDMLRGYDDNVAEYEKSDSRALTDEIKRYFLTGETMPGPEGEQALAKKIVPTITLDELNALAASRGAQGRVVTVSGPEGSAMPDAAKVAAILAEVDKSDLPAWVDAPVAASLMAAAPAPGKVTATRTIASVGVTEWTLSNGIKVVVKPTDFKNDDVEIEAFSPGGTSLASDKDYDSARFAADIVGDAGLAALDPIALEKALTGKVAHAGAWIGELEEGVDAGGAPQDLETVMQLVYLRFTAPRKDADAFAAWQTRTREYATHRRAEPESAFYEDMTQVVSQKHKRRQPVTPEAVDKVSLDKALAFYQSRFGDAGDFTFVIVGNVDLAKLQPLVETYLASLPTKHRKETWKDVGVHFPHGAKTLEVKGGEEPKAFVYYARNASEKWTKDVERDLGILQMLLSIRLREVLREDMSGVYGVRVSTGITRRPRQERQLVISFGCDPANVEKLEGAALDVVKAIQKDGLGADYLDKVKEQITREHETSMRDNRWWLHHLADAWRYGDDPAQLLDVQAILARVTTDNVKAAAKKYLDAKDSVLAVLRPAKVAAPAPAPAPAPAATAPTAPAK